jgi:MFS family permease
MNILAGIFAGEHERGKVFGILGLTGGLGSVLAGTGSGAIARQWGFPAMFLVLALLMLCQPLCALFLEDKPVVREQPAEAVGVKPRLQLRSVFYLLLLANTIACAASLLSALVRPLVMDKLGFDSAAISGVVAVGGAVGLPLPFVIGWLSDRLGRYRLLLLCYFTSALGLVVLGVSTALWHFWLASIIGAGFGASGAVSSALVTDLVPEQGLSLGLSLIGASTWVGGVLGFSLGGYAIQSVGLSATFFIGAAAALLALPVIMRIQHSQRMALV